ncbi:MAG TPA: FecR domain-containing protein [Chitinophaga sp.]|uniref:FecR family protein n=1 Tax=Chitinophaga sp. TaxID=1869181 RepID=UPI002B994A3B|nr:FecR domain-containing protein [Chitinophaga sp.]HVI47270.1 FecR domain-containing protein [Chitinophaga sp.]
MSDNRKRLASAIRRWLSGTGSPAESKFVELYYDSFETEPDITDEHNLEERALIFKRISASIGEENQGKVRRMGWWPVVKIAAVLLPVIGFISWWMLQSGHHTYPAITAYDAIIRTGSTEYKTCKLTDGTMVWLSPQSTLKVFAQAGAERIVELNGEAFFDVHTDMERPFVVRTAKLHTTVLGTSFNISAYNGSAAEKVVLLNGKVKVAAAERKADAIVLRPLQRVVWKKNADSLLVTDDPDAVLAADRRKGIYNYRNVPLKEVLEDVEKIYNVHVKYSTSLDACNFYGSFDRNEEVKRVLQKIALTLNGAAVAEGPQVYLLSGKACY